MRPVVLLTFLGGSFCMLRVFGPSIHLILALIYGIPSK